MLKHESKNTQDTRSDLLDRSSNVPLYQQIFLKLRREIMQGRWKEGDFFPTEAELEKEYGVSRITVRKALDVLVDRNLISRRQGRGTVVLRLAAVEDFPGPIDMQTAGHAGADDAVTVKVLATDYAPASDMTAEQLEVDVGEELGLIKTVHSSGGGPLCVQTSAFVHRYCPGILEAHDWRTASFYQTLAETYNIHLTRAVHTVSIATPTSPGITRWLQIGVDEPVLLVERVSYTQDGTPFEHVQTYYRADRQALRFETNRPFHVDRETSQNEVN